MSGEKNDSDYFSCSTEVDDSVLKRYFRDGLRMGWLADALDYGSGIVCYSSLLSGTTNPLMDDKNHIFIGKNKSRRWLGLKHSKMR